MGLGSTLPSGGLGDPGGRDRHAQRGEPIVTPRLRALLEKVASVERTLSAQRGPFDLFALIRREDARNWDVVVSAGWLPGESIEAIGIVVDALKDVVGGEGMMAFSRVVVLPADSDFLADVRDAYRATDDRRGVGPGQYGRVDVAEGFLFNSHAGAVGQSA